MGKKAIMGKRLVKKSDDRTITAMLYRMVNECNSTTVPMAQLYSELSAMLVHGATNERVDSILSQIDGKRH
jgi:hypothetical protein